MTAKTTVSTVPDTVVLNGVTYVKEGSITETPQPGKRVVVVFDRGWIFAGDVERVDGRIKMTRVVHVLGWSEIGFAGMLADPKNSKVRLKKMDLPVDAPSETELFCNPVDDNWGL